jgi:4-hydroxy-4-methyl-2-oxoglutarate aldolase
MREPLSRQLIQQLQSFDSPTISNAIEALSIRNRIEGYASMELRCLFPELSPMVGHAVTCTADSTSPSRKAANQLNELFDAIIAMPKPVVVVVKNCGPDRLRSCFTGDMVSVAYQKLGAAGVATDGGIRDLSGIRKRAPDFQIFAPGAVVSHGNATIVEVGIPVSVAGLAIEPGDLLHGDESGLLKIPNHLVEAVLREAELVRATEKEWCDFVCSDSFTIEGMKGRLTH